MVNRYPVPLRNIRMRVAYDGTDFLGWQSQPDLRTVQGTLEAALAIVTCEPVRLNVSGRTDAGVHALGQVMNFYSSTRHDCATLVKAVNAHLPEDVAITDCDDVPQSFDSNRDALRKTYRYGIYDTHRHNPFLRRFAYHHRRKLDTAAMDAGAKFLLGRHDFRSFETDWPNRLSSVRTILEASVAREGDLILVTVEADGFLYNMVRAIAGTLMKIGRGEWSPDFVQAIVASRDRREAGPNAPPEGLTLFQVTYADELARPVSGEAAAVGSAVPRSDESAGQ